MKREAGQTISSFFKFMQEFDVKREDQWNLLVSPTALAQTRFKALLETVTPDTCGFLIYNTVNAEFLLEKFCFVLTLP